MNVEFELFKKKKKVKRSSNTLILSKLIFQKIVSH